MIEVDKYREAFASEAGELLARLSKSLLTWEKNPRSISHLEECFRILHTLKGMAGAMGYEAMANLAHVMEESFSRAREGALHPSPDVMDVLLLGADLLEEGVQDPEGKVDEPRVKSVLSRLKASPVSPQAERTKKKSPERTLTPHGLWEVKVRLSEQTPFKAARAMVVLREALRFGQLTGTRPDQPKIERGDFQSSFSIFLDGISEPSAFKAHLTAIPEVEAVELSSGGRPSETTRRMEPPGGEEARVPLARLNALMNLVGELIVARESLRRIARDYHLFILEEGLARLTRVSSDLEAELMAARMVRAGDALERLPRLIRNQARTLGKEVDFTIDGSDIELDRAILDRVQEPLLHLLRNALDHGIESPEERAKKEKPGGGKIRLVVQRTRDRIILTVADDGRGIDLGEVTRAAVRKGILTEGEAKKLSKQETFDLLGHSGFSTARTITQTSGRGVGLNAVRSMIAAMGGRMTIDSNFGQGTSFTLYLPLSLAVIRILLVQVCGRPVAIPMSQVVESFRLLTTQVKPVHGRDVFFRRDEVIPLVRLAERWGWGSGSSGGVAKGPETSGMTVVEIEAGGRKAGLVVERLLGQEEIAIVGLDKLFAGIPEFSGVALLGAGNIALVLDAVGLFTSLDEE
jgi:two-component system chemotaxis sensor kinase CheA